MYINDPLVEVGHVVDALNVWQVGGLWSLHPRAMSVRTRRVGTMSLESRRTPRPTKGWSGSVKLRYWRPERYPRVRPAGGWTDPRNREDTLPHRSLEWCSTVPSRKLTTRLGVGSRAKGGRDVEKKEIPQLEPKWRQAEGECPRTLDRMDPGGRTVSFPQGLTTLVS